MLNCEVGFLSVIGKMQIELDPNYLQEKVLEVSSFNSLLLPRLLWVQVHACESQSRGKLLVM
jgi:hypothetical protein